MTFRISEYYSNIWYPLFSLRLQTTVFCYVSALLKHTCCTSRSKQEPRLVVARLFDDPWVPVTNNLTLSIRTASLHQLLQPSSAHNPLPLIDQYVFERRAFSSVDKVGLNSLNEVMSIPSAMCMMQQQTEYNKIMH